MEHFYALSIDPVAFSLFGEPFAWYWLNYLFGFLWLYLGICFFTKLPTDMVRRSLVWGWFGMLLGARLFYILFYFPSHYLQHPDQIIAFWNGGMSFHGGCFGATAAIWFLHRKNLQIFLQLVDAITFFLPMPLGLGRIANLANQELVGRVTDVPWAFVFPSIDLLPRHPSQIYEALTQGPLLFGCLILLQKYFQKKPGLIASTFLILYGTFRFITEFFREPDAQIGLFLRFFTMGQFMCLGMILIGISCYLYCLNRATQNNRT